MGYQINYYNFINNGWCFRLFQHGRSNFISLHLMKTPVGLFVIWISHLSVIQALGVYGSIGTKYIIIIIHIFMFRYMYVHCVFVCPLGKTWIGRATGLPDVVQCVLGMSCLCSEYRLFQGHVHISSFDCWPSFTFLVKLETSQL